MSLTNESCHYKYKGEPIVIFKVIFNQCGCTLLQFKIGDIKGAWTAYVSPDELEVI